MNEPERLSAYEILGLSPSASLVEIKTAYRKRVRACHPDLFADVMQVYRVKRNLINRFQRNRALQQLWQERDAT